jgi:hypothetical protein
MCDAIREMQNPTAVIVTFHSESLWDLTAAIDACREAFCKLRRLAAFRSVQAGVGGFEPKVSAGGTCFNFHAHLVLDIDRGRFDITTIAAAWARLTKGRGTFLLHKGAYHGEVVDPRNPYAIARYATKALDWCPKPATLSPKLLDLLWTALRGRRLFTSWTGAKSRVQKQAGVQVSKGVVRSTRRAPAKTFRRLTFALDRGGERQGAYEFVTDTLDRVVAKGKAKTRGAALELICMDACSSRHLFHVQDRPRRILRAIGRALGPELIGGPRSNVDDSGESRNLGITLPHNTDEEQSPYEFVLMVVDAVAKSTDVEARGRALEMICLDCRASDHTFFSDTRASLLRHVERVVDQHVVERPRVGYIEGVFECEDSSTSFD